MNTEQIKNEILKLKDSESFIVPESDYGKAEIWFKNGTYFLFEIPMYGGKPNFSKSYSKHCVDDMIKETESWT